MQTAEITVDSGSGVALWRGIPAQIQISGVGNTAGSWLFLVDNDNSDGAILSGSVAAADGALVVTIANMDTVELATAIEGRSILQCRATLTDGTSRVFLIPVMIRNRAVSGTPTPVAEYYDTAAIDAMIAAIPAQVQADWNEADTTAKSYIRNKPAIPSATVQSVNGKTGAVVLSASDVGALPTSGGELTATLSFDLTANSVTALSVASNGSERVTLRNGHLLLGLNNSATAYSGALAIGQNCNAAAGYGCVAIGKNVSNGKTCAIGVGEYLSEQSECQAVFGQYNTSDADAILVLGNGTSTNARKNAFVVKKTGDAVLEGDLTFRPTGASAATTLAALVARIEALEQALQ